MKKLLLSIFLIPIVGVSQTLNGISIENLDAKYIEIVGSVKILKPLQVTVTVNYGQIAKFKDWKKLQVLDENDKPYPFNGMMGVVNFFADKGYKLDMAYPVSLGNTLVYHYIMIKE